MPIQIGITGEKCEGKHRQGWNKGGGCCNAAQFQVNGHRYCRSHVVEPLIEEIKRLEERNDELEFALATTR